MTDIAVPPPRSLGGPTPDVIAAGPVSATVRRQGSGTPVLYLHGSHFAGLWLPFHERLSASTDVIAPSLPGYEEAAPPDWLQGFDDLVLHLRDVLDALGLQRVHVAGHDLGAWAAADLAIFCPERVQTLTLLAPIGLRVPGHAPVDWLATDAAQVAALLFAGDPADHAELLVDMGDPAQFSRSYGENGVTARLTWERRYDLKLDRRLPYVQVPTLVVSPEDDRIVPRAHVERWAELLPDATVETVAGTGHALVAEAPDAVAGLIIDFVEARS